MSNTVCIYCRTDFYGICAAAIVLQRFSVDELVGYNHGDELDLEQFRDRYVILLVDCSFQRFARTTELSKLASKVLWLDQRRLISLNPVVSRQTKAAADKFVDKLIGREGSDVEGVGPSSIT